MALSSHIQKNIAIDNLQKQEKDIKSQQSIRLWHLSELAHVASDMVKEKQSESIRTQLSTLAEIANELYESAKDSAGEMLACRDAFHFSTLLASRLLSCKESMVREIISAIEPKGIVSLPMGRPSSQAFMAASKQYAHLSPLQTNDIREACSAFRADEAKFALLPYMDEDGLRMLPVHNIVCQNQLKLIGLFPSATTLFALYGRGMFCPGDPSSCFMQFELPAEDLPKLTALAGLAEARCLSSASYLLGEDVYLSVSLLFGEKTDIFGILLYIALFHPQITISGMCQTDLFD